MILTDTDIARIKEERIKEIEAKTGRRFDLDLSESYLPKN